MAIILKKLKGKPVNRDHSTADWDRLLTLIKILLILFLVFSGFHWIIKKKVHNRNIVPALSKPQTTSTQPVDNKYKVYTVRNGDTLWSIVLKQYPNQNTEKMIKEIETLNHVSQQSIRPGQPLKLP